MVSLRLFMGNKVLLLILLCTLKSFNSYAFIGRDTVFTSFSTNKNFFDFSKKNWQNRDTSINGLQVYQPAFKNSFTNTFLGNIGLPVRTLIPAGETELGFRLEKQLFGLYLIKPEDVNYYNTRKPFTSVCYIQGTKKEQVLDITHTQNLNPQINVGFKYTRVKSDGYYARQNTSYNNVVLFSSGSDKKQRVAYLSNITYNKLVAYENWGLVPDSSFESIGFAPKTLLQVNNTNAQNNRWLYGAYFKPYINIGKINSNDTTQKYPQHASRVFFETKASRYSRKYFDPYSDKTFYGTLNNDSLYTNDSTSNNMLKSIIGYETNEYNKDGKKRKILFSVKAGGEWFDVLNYFKTEIAGSKKLNNTYLGGVSANNFLTELNMRFSPDSGKLNSDISIQNVWAGYNKGDLLIQINNLYKLTESGSQQALFNINYSSRTPDFFQSEYFANALSFSTDTFIKINLTKIEAGYINRKLNLTTKITYQLFDNFIYYDYSSKPTQLTSTQDLLSIFISKHFKINKFNLKLNFLYNKTSFNALRIPEIINYNSLYFENRIFKKSTLGQIGIDVRFMTGTKGLAYSPVLSQYYITNNSLPSYPFLDFFINFKISTFRMFFKIEHFNAGFFGNRYYVSDNQPLNDRAIKLGIIWTFHY